MLRMQEMAFPGFKISQIFLGNMPDPVAFSHSYPSPIYPQKGPLSPHRKILKKGPDQYTKKKL
jgi:hypothetical protein